jgi:hypothetical protein
MHLDSRLVKLERVAAGSRASAETDFPRLTLAEQVQGMRNLFAYLAARGHATPGPLPHLEGAEYVAAVKSWMRRQGESAMRPLAAMDEEES